MEGRWRQHESIAGYTAPRVFGELQRYPYMERQR